MNFTPGASKTKKKKRNAAIGFSPTLEIQATQEEREDEEAVSFEGLMMSLSYRGGWNRGM